MLEWIREKGFENGIHPGEFLIIGKTMTPKFCAEGVWVKEIIGG